MLEIKASNFREQVLADEGAVLVDFWAAWCMPCRMLAPTLEKVAREYRGKVKVVKVNVDENPGLAEEYQIMSIPTLVLFSHGQPVQRVSGVLPESQLRQLLDRAL